MHADRLIGSSLASLQGEDIPVCELEDFPGSLTTRCPKCVAKDVFHLFRCLPHIGDLPLGRKDLGVAQRRM